MAPTRSVLVVLAALVLVVGAGAAAPTPDDQPGPPDDLTVPEFVGDVLDTLEQFVVDLLDGLAASGTDARDGGTDESPAVTERTTTADTEPVWTTTADAGERTETTQATTATGTTAPPYTLSIDRIETCGETCRDVTTTLTNERATAASNVTVHTRVYAGNGTDGDLVWEGTEAVGALEAGESYTATERVELSLVDAYTVKQHDGRVTVQTTVQSDDETVTVTEHRDLT